MVSRIFKVCRGQ